jgi:hypothetical protein
MRFSFALLSIVLPACGGSTAAPPSPTTQSPATSLSGQWTLHQFDVHCAATPADAAVSVSQFGTDVTLNVGDLAFSGTLSGAKISFASKYGDGIGVPAGDCSYEGTVSADDKTMTGSFGCECVTGSWTATR